MDNEDFRELSFCDFSNLAKIASYDRYQKSGFKSKDRINREDLIFKDISNKLYDSVDKNLEVLEIGPGCSPLIEKHINFCSKNSHQLWLIDSQEILDLIPNSQSCHLISGNIVKLYDKIPNFDRILMYSVLQHIYLEHNIFQLVGNLINKLNPGGCMLIGDVPNIDKTKRFLSSKQGQEYHNQNYSHLGETPIIDNFHTQMGRLNDAVIMSLASFIRSCGANAYILDQNTDLPYSQRREDILIKRF